MDYDLTVQENMITQHFHVYLSCDGCISLINETNVR